MSAEHSVPVPPPGHTHTNDHDKRPYMRIFWALLALTVLEISTIFIPHGTIPHLILAIFLLALAVGKAALVAMYYMHLRYDPWMLAAIFIAPFGLALFFTFLLVIQY